MTAARGRPFHRIIQLLTLMVSCTLVACGSTGKNPGETEAMGGVGDEPNNTAGAGSIGGKSGVPSDPDGGEPTGGIGGDPGSPAGGDGGSSGFGGTSGSAGSGDSPGSGGSAGSAGSSGSGGSGGPVIVEDPLVWQWGQADHEDLEADPWVVDNAQGQREGSNAVHPPALKADKPQDMTLNCDDAVHTQLTFQVFKPGSGTLSLLVDGVERQASITAYNNQWSYYVFDVAQNSHVYTFRALSGTDAASSFVVDSIRCRNVDPAVNPDQKVDFDQSFVPEETSGWFVDNAVGVHPDGTDTGFESASHPAALKADKPQDMTFNCGDVVHTQLTFQVFKPGGGTLSLLVDGVERQASITAYNNQWSYYVFDVAQTSHVYTFRALSGTDAASSFVVDSIRCRNVDPAVNPDQKVDFDQSFVPQETSGWFVDNAVGVHPDGTDTGFESASHPAALKADKPQDMTFNCGGVVHTQLTFQVYKPGSGTLSLLVDGVERQASITAYNNQWSYYVFDVAQTSHVYTFRALSGTDAASSFVVDSIRCRNVDPAVNPDQKVDFDQSFVPQETSGWFVDNAVGVHPDGTDTGFESASHPAALKADKPQDMTFNCGGVVHTQLTFQVYKPGSGTLSLLVDGVERQASITAYNNQWSYYVFDVAQTSHVYTFRALSGTDAASSFVVDSIRCRNVDPAVNPDQKVDFDQSFVPQETSGWFVDNAVGVHPDGTDTGFESASHPAALKADKPQDMTFNCGGVVHTQLTFQVYKPGSGTLSLLVDGVERQASITAYNNQWSAYTITSASAVHVYTFRAQSSADVASSFVLDTIACKP